VPQHGIRLEIVKLPTARRGFILLPGVGLSNAARLHGSLPHLCYTCFEFCGGEIWLDVYAIHRRRNARQPTTSDALYTHVPQ